MFIDLSIIILYNSFSCLCLLCHPHQYVHGVQLPRVKVWNSLNTKYFYFLSGCEFGRGLIFSIFSSWLVDLVKVDHGRETFNTIFCGLLLVVDPTKICDCEYGAIVSQPSKVNGCSSGPTWAVWLGTRFHWPRHLCAPSSQWTCVTMIYSYIRII